MTETRLNVLFLSDRDALRGPMARGFLTHALTQQGPSLSENLNVQVYSAGLDPVEELDPMVRAVMSERSILIHDQHPRSVGELKDVAFDLIITLTPDAQRACSENGSNDDLLPLFIGTPMHVHWSIDSNRSAGSVEDLLAGARTTRDDLQRHVHSLVEQGYLEALATERLRARLLIDAIDVGIVVHDEQRRLYHFNAAAERITGRRREDVLGRNCHDVFPPDGICGSHCAFKHGNREPFDRRDYVVSFSASDGTARRLRMLASPMTIHEGRPAEVVAQVTDVTEIDSLRWTLKDRQSLHGMVGSSPAMRGVFEIIRQVSTSDYPVLISGESGTGKELAARAIHSESRRAEGPFVPINCGALPEHILESELFGHVRGAFTGAIRDKKGRFELAHGGTIFLDEVGELTPAFQVKLLRVLQEMRFERVGGERTIEVDVRVISATNRDLRQMVQRREFREDLFYRLCVVPIALPSLRERRTDIPLLVEHILERIQQETGRKELSLSSAAMDLLLAHRWPGNVRELINSLQFAAVRSAGAEIGAQYLPPEVRQETPTSLGDERSPQALSLMNAAASKGGRKKLDIETVVTALNQTGGNKVQAAKLLGVGRATLYRFINDNPLP